MVLEFRPIRSPGTFASCSQNSLFIYAQKSSFKSHLYVKNNNNKNKRKKEKKSCESSFIQNHELLFPILTLISLLKKYGEHCQTFQESFKYHLKGGKLKEKSLNSVFVAVSLRKKYSQNERKMPFQNSSRNFLLI